MAKADKKPPLGSGERFQMLTHSLEEKGAQDAAALAAYIGRKKYGKEKFQKMAANGKKKK